MTALDLPAIRALLEGATPGPWEEYWRGIIHAPAYPAVSICQTYGPEDQRHPNAAFIAAAPSIVAQLVAAVEAGLAACETVIDNTDGHKPPGPPHPSREQATAMRIRVAITGEGQ